MIDWKTIILQNPWWKGNKDLDLLKVEDSSFFIERKNLKITPNTIYLIKGPRRVGKSIYLKTIAQNNPKDSTYINLDTLPNIKINDLIKTIEQDISVNSKKILLLDEIQSLEDGCEFLKAMVDLNTLKDVCVFVTGSDPRSIEKCKQVLIGRSQEIKIMFPLTFRQFLLTILKKENSNLFNILKNSKINLEDKNNIIFENYKILEPYFIELDTYFKIFLLTGGFPETINSYFSTKKISEKYYEDIIQKIFEKMDKNKSINILKIIVDCLSCSLKYTTLSRKTSYSQDTIKSYLEDLEELLIIFEIKESSKSLIKKFYIKDPFIIHSIINYYNNLDSFIESKNLLFNELELGKFVENVVGSHLHNIYNLNLKYFNVDKKEVDFIYKNKAVEVKYRNNIVMPNLIDGVEEYIILSKLILGPADIIQDNRLVIPVCIFLGLLENPNNFL